MASALLLHRLQTRSCLFLSRGSRGTLDISIVILRGTVVASSADLSPRMLAFVVAPVEHAWKTPARGGGGGHGLGR